MLVLSRKTGESVYIGNDIKIVVTRVEKNGSVRLAISAPQEITIHREEIYQAIQKEAADSPQKQPWTPSPTEV